MGDVSTVRAAVTAAIDALDGWSVSKFIPELFGRDTDHVAHHAFAVAVVSTEPRDGRQSLTDGCLVVSSVEVYWAHRLRGDNQVADYSAACDAEQDMVKAVVGISSQHILIQRLSRAAKVEGFVIGTAAFSVIHRYSLA